MVGLSTSKSFKIFFKILQNLFLAIYGLRFYIRFCLILSAAPYKYQQVEHLLNLNDFIISTISISAIESSHQPLSPQRKRKKHSVSLHSTKKVQQRR